MSLADDDHEWAGAVKNLATWHRARDRGAARAGLTFLEIQLRRRIPAEVRRRWPTEQVEDTLQGFLERLLSRPLPAAAAEAPAGYLCRAFRNWCIDVERGRRRRSTEPWDDDAEFAVARDRPDHAARERLEKTVAALGGLSVADRTALKLAHAPDLLTDEELDWLGARCGIAPAAVDARLRTNPSVYDLTLLFDPGPEPTDAKGRRDRMERFRKRRERARERLQTLLDGGSR